jgi:hypothetical protein
VEQVVRLLATHLAGKERQGLVGGAGQRRQADRIGGLVQVAAGDAERPVAARMVEEGGMPVVLRAAAVGDPVGVIIGQLGQQLVERPRVTDLVLRDRAGGDILLQHRRDAGPLRVPEADDELVVGKAQQELRERVTGRGIERLGLHSPASVATARALAASSLCLMM